MNRNKVLELAREAELARQIALKVPFVVDRLERFAALIEREVCGGMSRDKVFELMLTAGCSKYCDPKHPELEGFIVNDFVLERIVALIEREVRGDAEPTAWMYDFLNSENRDEVIRNWLTQDPTEIEHAKGFNVRPLYLHPAPAVVAQLVEAAKRAMNYAENVVMAEGVYFDHDDDLPFIESALAAAKETGI